MILYEKDYYPTSARPRKYVPQSTQVTHAAVYECADTYMHLVRYDKDYICRPNNSGFFFVVLKIHAMLGIGAQICEQIFPGILGDLVSEGAFRFHVSNILVYMRDKPIAKPAVDHTLEKQLTTISCTRPFWEYKMRQVRITHRGCVTVVYLTQDYG